MSNSELVAVTVRRSGGLTGIARTWTVRVADLSPSQAAELHRLFAAASADWPLESGSPAPAKPDAFSFELEVVETAARRRTSVDRSRAAASVRGLLDFVVKRGAG